MKILVAGDWYSDVHEDGVFQAYEKLGHEVFKFSWHQYFECKILPTSAVFKIKLF